MVSHVLRHGTHHEAIPCVEALPKVSTESEVLQQCRAWEMLGDAGQLQKPQVNPV
jgi:hypothetical protein